MFEQNMSRNQEAENLHRLTDPLSQSIERGRISREGALDVRESRKRRDKILAEKKTPFCPRKIQKFKSKTAIFMRKFPFLAAETPTFGGRVYLQNWLASLHPGAYTTMPQPLFDAQDVCYTEKKVGTKKAFLKGGFGL